MNFNNLFELIGGRKFGLMGAVTAALLTFIGTGALQGEERLWAIVGCVIIAICYGITNVWQKDVDGKNGQSNGGEVK